MPFVIRGIPSWILPVFSSKSLQAFIVSFRDSCRDFFLGIVQGYIPDTIKEFSRGSINHSSGDFFADCISDSSRMVFTRESFKDFSWATFMRLLSDLFYWFSQVLFRDYSRNSSRDSSLDFYSESSLDFSSDYFINFSWDIGLSLGIAFRFSFKNFCRDSSIDFFLVSFRKLSQYFFGRFYWWLFQTSFEHYLRHFFRDSFGDFSGIPSRVYYEK